MVMADRVNYFLLGLLFLIVAGVIAYDRWNPGGEPPAEELASNENSARITVDRGPQEPAPRTIKIDPEPAAVPSGESRRGRLDLNGEPFAPDPDVARVTSPTPAPRPDVRPEPPRVVPSTQPPTATRFHIVKSGESLEIIAQNYYGSKRFVGEIVRANNISDPNRIYEKQKLVIPALNESVRRAAPAPAPTPRRAAPATIPSSYKVKRSDGDLYKICARFYGRAGLARRVDQVMELNGLWSADVGVGATLQLPRR
jgi:LysM repeat protein